MRAETPTPLLQEKSHKIQKSPPKTLTIAQEPCEAEADVQEGCCWAELPRSPLHHSEDQNFVSPTAGELGGDATTLVGAVWLCVASHPEAGAVVVVGVWQVRQGDAVQSHRPRSVQLRVFLGWVAFPFPFVPAFAQPLPPSLL